MKETPTFSIIVKTLLGLEEPLAKEIEGLGVPEEDILILTRAVKFEGNQELLYKSNLLLRTASKVLKPIATFEAFNDKMLYKEIKNIDWSKYMTVDQTFAIDAVTSGEVFRHTKYVALKSKDAIADQFREREDRRPSVDTKNYDLRINVHISHTQCTVSLDSSGVSLDKRGYRLERVHAPISELLAAGIILLSGWDRETTFIDPMCGSGTFSIEAALLATNTPPNNLRSFAFQKWNNFDQTLWQKIKVAANAQVVPANVNILASDIDKKSISIAIANTKRARMTNFIGFKQADFLEERLNIEGQKSLLILNPPYGERLENEEDIIPFYQEIGTKLKHTYDGADAWIISGNMNALKFIGLRPSRKIKLFNGKIECRLQKYQLYRGSKRRG